MAASSEQVHVSSNKSTTDNLKHGKETQDISYPNNWYVLLRGFQGIEWTELREGAIGQELDEAQRVN